MKKAMSRPFDNWRGRFPPNQIISLLDTNLPFNLAESTVADLRLGELLDIIGIDALLDLKLGYGSAAGSEDLRTVVGGMLGVSPDQIITTNGVQLALAMLALELCRPGDEIVLASPYFPASRDLFAGLGLTVHEMRLTFDNGYQVEARDFLPLLSPATRLVSLASPQNPSGVATPIRVLEELLELMKLHAPNASLFVDETYREAIYEGDPTLPSAAALDPRVLTASSLSKAHGAAGLRVGWVTVPDAELRERLRFAKMNLVISGSPLNEAFAAALLHRREEILAPRRRLLKQALDSLDRWHAAEADRLDWVQPDAGGLCCFRLSAKAFDDDAVERFWTCLDSHDLQLGNGTWFGESARIFRLGFGYLPIDKLPGGLEAISSAMNEVQLPGRRANTSASGGGV